MVNVERPKVGPYVLMRALAPGRLAARWLALNEVDQSSHVVYRFPICHDKAEQRRFLSAVGAASALFHEHILRVEQFSFDVAGRPWVVAPFIGDVGGLMTLGRLLRDKGGLMSPDEAERAVTQVLEASDHAVGVGQHHGPIALDEVLVGRHGSLFIELYGMARGLKGLTRGNSELVRDEVLSIVEIAYQLLTGLRADEPLIPAGRLVKRLDPRWDAWLDQGLDPSGGFATASEALAALPGRVERTEVYRPAVNVRSMLWRLRTAR